MGPKGTLSCSAPEQISKKKFGYVDWSTDVFQLGIIFYEILTGEHPFYDDDPAGIMGKIMEEESDPASSLDPEIPEELDDFILKAIQKQKQNRWSSADVMYYELKRIVENQQKCVGQLENKI